MKQKKNNLIEKLLHNKNKNKNNKNYQRIIKKVIWEIKMINCDCGKNYGGGIYLGVANNTDNKTSFPSKGMTLSVCVCVLYVYCVCH